mmetsp:Transcript_24027/g.47963  ORF Transcript_24027/g.47963 Transcript_24027/m.47963 type:complete len:271 (-) Transcript_24027:114-926(-)
MIEFTQLVPVSESFDLFNEFHKSFRSKYEGIMASVAVPIEMAMICWRLQKSCSAAAYLFEIVYHEDRGKLAGLDLWHLLKAANATHSEAGDCLIQEYIDDDECVLARAYALWLYFFDEGRSDLVMDTIKEGAIDDCVAPSIQVHLCALSDYAMSSEPRSEPPPAISVLVSIINRLENIDEPTGAPGVSSSIDQEEKSPDVTPPVLGHGSGAVVSRAAAEEPPVVNQGAYAVGRCPDEPQSPSTASCVMDFGTEEEAKNLVCGKRDRSPGI